MKSIVITIDGPAGAGKTTIGKALSDRLGYRYVDTGALYRAIALAAERKNLTKTDDDAIQMLLSQITVDLPHDRPDAVLLNGEDVFSLIRTPSISKLASDLSAKPFVRSFLLSLQRHLGETQNVVFEGRDTGTVIFPNSPVKFFLFATLSARAKRRYLEFLKKGVEVTLEDVEKDISLRDQNDSTRSLAPLKPAPDAILIDSTDLSINQVVDKMVFQVEQKLSSFSR